MKIPTANPLWFIAAGIALWVNAVEASESPNYRLTQHRIVSGVGACASSNFLEKGRVVGLSAAGSAASPNFILKLEADSPPRPPGGSGIPIEVRGTVDDDEATVSVRAKNTVQAVVSPDGNWRAASVRLAEGPNTITATARNAGGLETTRSVRVIVDTIPPAPPTLRSVTTPTAQTSQTLSGTKEAETEIWLNGLRIVPLNPQTSWNYIHSPHRGSIRSTCGRRTGPVIGVPLSGDRSFLTGLHLPLPS